MSAPPLKRAAPLEAGERLTALLSAGGVGSPLALCLLAFAGIPLFLTAIDQIIVIRYLYPALALGVAAYLYIRSPPHYLGLCLWLFFVTPFVRRIVDANEGWLQANPVMLSPYIAASFTFFAVVGYAMRSKDNLLRLVPFALLVGAAGYGFLVGLVRGYVFSGILEALRWCIPVFTAVFILEHRRLAGKMRSVVISCFLWALPLLGLYGLVQFVWPPPWDLYWMHDSPGSPYGRSEALRLRVFSTMNSPQSFATAAAAGLLLLTSVRGWWSWLAGAPALIALLLTLSRAVFGGFVGGLAYLLAMGPRKARLRTASFLALGTCAVVTAAIAFPSLQAHLTARVERSIDVESDPSARSRLQQYDQFPRLLLDAPLGRGISWKGTYGHLDAKDDFTVDSGIIETFLGFGVIGGIAYFAGLGICLVRLGKIALVSEDPFVHACAAIAVLGALQLPFQHQFIGPSGFIVWLFIGAGLAHRRRGSSSGRGSQRARRTRRGGRARSSGSAPVLPLAAPQSIAKLSRS